MSGVGCVVPVLFYSGGHQETVGVVGLRKGGLPADLREGSGGRGWQPPQEIWINESFASAGPLVVSVFG